MKNTSTVRGFFSSGASRKRRVWGGNPNKIPTGQNERLAKFGTVVESCSKKVAASSVWDSADTLDGQGGDSANLCGGISPSDTYKTAQGRIDGDFRKFLHFPFIPHTTGNLKTTKNGRKKTGNLFLISCFGVALSWAMVIQFSCNYSLTNLNSDKTLFIAFINCYILSSKSPQTLQNAKFIASEFALRFSLVLYPFPKQSNGLFLLLNSHKGKNKGKKNL